MPEPEFTPEQADAIAALGRATGEWGKAFLAVSEAGVEMRVAFEAIGIPLPPFAGFYLDRMVSKMSVEEDETADDDEPAALTA